MFIFGFPGIFVFKWSAYPRHTTNRVFSRQRNCQTTCISQAVTFLEKVLTNKLRNVDINSCLTLFFGISNLMVNGVDQPSAWVGGRIKKSCLACACRTSLVANSWRLRSLYQKARLLSDYNKLSKVRKVRKRIAVCTTSAAPLRELTCHMGSQCYLPPGRGDISAFTPAN